MKQRQHINLLEGNIAGTLAKLAFPIMGTSFIQMAYNLTDMIWIGRVSSNAVAAVGAAGMYLWLATGFVTVPRMGGQVKTAHAIGAGESRKAGDYARAAFHMGILLMLLCTGIYVFANEALISFFKLNQESVIRDARIYLVITGLGTSFTYLNLIFTGMFMAIGNSMVTFRATTVGLIINIILDPALIFGVGFFPELGVSGAAIATVLAQVIVLIVFLLEAGKDKVLFDKFSLWEKSGIQEWKEITKIGFPIAAQSTIFSSLTMLIARLVAGFGDAAVAVQKVGGQIESISWMTADGFAAAINAFVAQNHGAGKKERVYKGYLTGISIMLLWGFLTTVILYIFAGPLFSIFIPEKEVLPMGVNYLRILSISQMLMCLEIASAGAFQGLGRPMIPAVAGILGNASRIVLAVLLSTTALGLNGIWWSISISSIAKGVVVGLCFVFVIRKYRLSGQKAI